MYTLCESLADFTSQFALTKDEKSAWDKQYSMLSMKEQRMLDTMTQAKAGKARLQYQRQVIKKSPDMLKKELQDPENIKYYERLLAKQDEERKRAGHRDDVFWGVMGATMVVDSLGRAARGR